MEKQEAMELLEKYDEAVGSFSLSKTMQASKELKNAISAIFTVDQFASILAAGSDRVKILPCAEGDIVWATDSKPPIPLRVSGFAMLLCNDEIDVTDYERLENWGAIIHPSREAALAAQEGAEHER